VDEREETALAELLRKALHEEAARHVPAGDGLSLIRDRVQARRRFGWARPVLVMGAVAAVAAAAAVIPNSLLHGRPDRTGDSVAGGSGQLATASLATPRKTNTIEAQSVAPDSTAITLPPAAGVADMRTVWPYGSRAQGYYHAEQDVRSGQHPELFDPGQTAVSFVHRYVGDNVKLLSDPTVRTGTGVSVVVSRVLPDGTRHAVTRVQLVPVSRQVKAPWVVAAADRPDKLGAEAKDPQAQNSLTASAPYQVASGTNQIWVTGSVGRPGGKDAPQVKVELFDAEGRSLSFNQAVVTRSDQVTYSWSTQINADPDQVSQAASVAAWTLDENADVLELVAVPAPAIVVRVGGAPTSPPTATPDVSTPVATR
jgi:hypothetical protein